VEKLKTLLIRDTGKRRDSKKEERELISESPCRKGQNDSGAPLFSLGVLRKNGAFFEMQRGLVVQNGGGGGG